MNYIIPPQLQIIATCEEIIFDKVTGKYTIKNIFSALSSSNIPFKRDILFFFAVSNYVGKSANIGIQIYDKYGILTAEKTDTIYVEIGKPDLCYAFVFEHLEFICDGIHTFKLFFNGIEYENNHLKLNIIKLIAPKMSLKSLVQEYFA